MAVNLLCDNCNYKTGESPCWYCGEMTRPEILIRTLLGCDFHRPRHGHAVKTAWGSWITCSCISLHLLPQDHDNYPNNCGKNRIYVQRGGDFFPCFIFSMSLSGSFFGYFFRSLVRSPLHGSYSCIRARFFTMTALRVRDESGATFTSVLDANGGILSLSSLNPKEGVLSSLYWTWEWTTTNNKTQRLT